MTPEEFFKIKPHPIRTEAMQAIVYCMKNYQNEEIKNIHFVIASLITELGELKAENKKLKEKK